MFIRTFLPSTVALSLLVTVGAAAGDEPQPAPQPTTQAAPQPAPQSVAQPPDVVVLKDGGMLRGTIVEMDAKKDVTITLTDGKSRTVSMAEVEYAGPESERPNRVRRAPPASTQASREAEPRPMVTVDSKPARIAFVANGPDISLYIRTSSFAPTGSAAAGYEAVCTAPCSATVPAGTQQFALSKGTGRAVAPKKLVDVSGDSKLEGKYTSRAGTRTAGWVILGFGAGLGSVMMLTEDGENNHLVFGSLAVLASVAFGLPLGLTRDKVEISVVPTAAAPKGTTHAGSSRWPSGLALSGRF